MWSRLCRFRLKMGASEEPAPRRLTAHSVLTIVGGVLVVGAVAWVTKHGVRAAVERPIYRQIADGFPSDDALGASDEFWAATHSACLLSAYEDGAPYHVDCDAWATPPPGLDNTTCAKPDTYMVERCAERAWCRRLCGETLRTHEARGRRRTGARARARARERERARSPRASSRSPPAPQVALCAFEHLSDLPATCAAVAAWPAGDGAAEAAAAAAARRRLREDDEYAVPCDHFAYCHFCDAECRKLVNPTIRVHHLLSVAKGQLDDDGMAGARRAPRARAATAARISRDARLRPTSRSVGRHPAVCSPGGALRLRWAIVRRAEPR